MLVTLSGIVTLVSPLQPENAESPMPRIPVKSRLPESVSVKPTTQPSTSFTPGMVVVSYKEELQPENAPYAILVTLSGIVTLVSLLQPENAESPMFFTLFGIVTLVRPFHLENTPFPMFLAPLGIAKSPATNIPLRNKSFAYKSGLSSKEISHHLARSVMLTLVSP